jgi:hypothetical protein
MTLLEQLANVTGTVSTSWEFITENGITTATPPDSRYAEFAAAVIRGEVVPNRIAAVKWEAGRRILSVIPDWKQRNLLARSIELTRVANKSPTELAEQTAIDALWSYAKAVRAASDTFEADPALDPFDDANWPVAPS